MDQSKQAELRSREERRQVYERLERLERAVQRVESAAGSAARDASRLEKILLNGGSGEIRQLSDRMTKITKHFDDRIKPVEKLAYMALGASAITPALIAVLGLLATLGLLSGPAQ